MLERLMPVSRVRVLSFLLHADTSYLREVARGSGVALRAAQRELAMLEQIGIVRRTPRGRQVFFAVRRDHPLVAPLRALLAGDGVERKPVQAAARPADAREVVATPAPEPRAPSASRTSNDWRVW